MKHIKIYDNQTNAISDKINIPALIKLFGINKICYVPKNAVKNDDGTVTLQPDTIIENNVEKQFVKCILESSENEPTNPITVYINGEEKTVDGDKTWEENGYDYIFKKDDCSYEYYNISSTDYPNEGSTYGTESYWKIDVTIDNSTISLNKFMTFHDQGYDTVYDLDNSMNTCDSPSDGGRYSTDCISVTIDNSDYYMSSNYSFSSQGYSTMYDIDSSMNDCTSDSPSEGHKYSSDYITVTINKEDANVSSHYAFYEQGHSDIYNVNGTFADATNDYPSENGIYSTNAKYIWIDDTEVEICPDYTFAEQGYNTICSRSGDGCSADYYYTDCSSEYPAEYSYYYQTEPSSKPTVTIDNDPVELFPHLTFAEQGYTDIYREVDGEDIDCKDEYPSTEYEYWTT